MKISALALLAVIGCASAAKNGNSNERNRNMPKLSIKVRDGKFDGLDALDPTLSWSDSTKSGDLDLSYGIEASATPTSDLASLPRSVWGKASTEMSGWGVSARAEVDAQERNSADLEFDANNAEADLSLHLEANAGKSDFTVRRVEATKGIDMDDARVTINPRYNLETEEADVVVNYSNDKTSVKLVASADSQEVTVSQQIDDDNRIAPTINSNGELSVEWERRLGDDRTLTARVKPNDNLDVEWKDDAWTANVNMPIDGTNINGANVSIKRDVNF
jgi:hypothetical protein